MGGLTVPRHLRGVTWPNRGGRPGHDLRWRAGSSGHPRLPRASPDQEGTTHVHAAQSRHHRPRRRRRARRGHGRPDVVDRHPRRARRLCRVRAVRRLAADRHQRGNRRHDGSRTPARGLPAHVPGPDLPRLRAGHRLAGVAADRVRGRRSRVGAAARGVRHHDPTGRPLPRRVPGARGHPGVAAVGSWCAHRGHARQRPADRGDAGAAGREEPTGHRPGDLRRDRRQRARHQCEGRLRGHRSQQRAAELRAGRPRLRAGPGDDLLPHGHRPGGATRRAPGRQPRGRRDARRPAAQLRPVPARPARRRRHLREELRRRPRLGALHHDRARHPRRRVPPHVCRRHGLAGLAARPDPCGSQGRAVGRRRHAHAVPHPGGARLRLEPGPDRCADRGEGRPLARRTRPQLHPLAPAARDRRRTEGGRPRQHLRRRCGHRLRDRRERRTRAAHGRAPGPRSGRPPRARTAPAA